MKWQRRLCERFVAGSIPSACDLPTGLGKTSVIAIWYLARRAGARIPRRLVYVVDRRAVVDQATEEAEKIKRNAQDDSLRLSTLRGQYVDNREWLADPAAQAIIIGTVDMVGSRLLFEGYGVSRKMRPFQAGLLGADTLFVLDESHLVPPFEALVREIANGAEQFGTGLNRDHSIIPAFRLLSLSATGRGTSAHGGADAAVFGIQQEDFSDPVVRKRLAAKKTARIFQIAQEKDSLAEALVEHARKISHVGEKPIRCLIYCDSRDVAEKVNDKLGKVAETELFVGARRAREREEAKKRLASLGFLAGSASPEKPTFLVSTAAGEVGVDLDADHMVCDLVPWERMIQRLGRVNRRGEGDASVVVLHTGEPQPKKPAEPTAQEKRQVIAFQSLAVFEALPRRGEGRDVSPGALRELKLRAATDESLRRNIEAATTPEPLRPALTRPLVDAWSMTSLEHHTGRPTIAPWLRGWIEEEPQTTVIWRSHLPVRENGTEWPPTTEEIKEFFEAAPPHISEVLETETYRVAAWLQSRAATLLGRSEAEDAGRVDAGDQKESGEDQAHSGETEKAAASLRRHDVAVIVLTAGGELKIQYRLSELARRQESNARKAFEASLADGVAVVDARFGGLGREGLLNPTAGDVPITADGSSDWSKQPTFRLRRVVLDRGTEMAPEARDTQWRFEDEFGLRRDAGGNIVEKLVVEHYRDSAAREDARSVSRPQELSQHQSCAEDWARRIAQGVGLSGISAEALAVAAVLHDEGKRALRWQRAFNAQNSAKKSGLELPLAKTSGPINQAILGGYRHEFGSLPYAEKNPRFRDLPGEWQELVLHLIASHHGGARPVISTLGCEDAPPSALEMRARDVALRFARLQKQWGPWGLAWWEALLRAADQSASRENDQRDVALSPAGKI